MAYSYYERCGNTEPHDEHSHLVAAIERCSGMTACGLYAHEAHDIETELKKWCYGICGCSTRGRIHGPGDHK